MTAAYTEALALQVQVVLVVAARAFARHIGAAGIGGTAGIGEKAIPRVRP